MKKLPLQGRTLALLAVIIPLLVLFIYVGLRSGPLAPVAVTVASVESRAITPALFGIGTLHLQDRADVCRARQTPGGACRRPGQGRTGARRDGAGRP